MLENKGRIDSVIEFRGNFLELLVVAVAIALGINLISGVLGATLSPIWATLLSIGLILTACLVVLSRIAPRINRGLSLRGLIAVSKKEKRIIQIDRYRFSKEISDNFRALFHENKAFERIWLESDLSPTWNPNADKSRTTQTSSGKKLVREAIEYFILGQLSNDLGSYFNENAADMDDGSIITIQRNDIPSVLLDNRFLDFLSRPMEEREAFSSLVGKNEIGKTVYAITGDGAIYDHFELVLPLGTIVTRESDHSFEINTKRFSLRFTTTFDGFNDNLPASFEKLYLGLPFREVDTYVANIYVDVKFKWRSMLSRKGWEYFKWVDLFLTNLEKSFSFDSFLQRIGWDTSYTIAMINKHLDSASAKPRPARTPQRLRPPR